MKRRWSKPILAEFLSRPEVAAQFDMVKTSVSMCVLKHKAAGVRLRLIRLVAIENDHHCGFFISCFVRDDDGIDEDTWAVDLPGEVQRRGMGGFDAGLLFQRHARKWSILNEALDGYVDGPLTGSARTIESRIPRAVDDAIDKIRRYVIPFFSHVEQA
jgi:hypothetical protein